jgi:CheY-like chemotaxis protein
MTPLGLNGGLSGDTEVLSRHGWRSGLTLKVDDEVATYDCTRNSYKFDRVSSVSVRHYDGPLIHLEARGLDCRLTPGHPVLLKARPQPGVDSPWRYQVAGDLPRNFKIPVVGPLRASGLSGISNDLLQVIGWVVASGSYHSRGARPVLAFQRSTVVKKRGQRLVDKIDRGLAHFKGVGRYERQARPVINYCLGRSLSAQVLECMGDELDRIPRPILEPGPPRQLSLLFETLMDMNCSEKEGRWATFYAGQREAYVDDFQELATRMGGVKVHTATRGMDALRIARVLHPEVIVLEVAMPGMDGFEVLDALKQQEETAAIPVVLFTGAVRRRDVKRRPEICLTKPCAPDEMLRIVRTVAAEKRRL